MIFLIPIRYWAKTQLETESGPAAASLSHSRVAHPAGLPQPRPSSPAGSPPVRARSRPSLPCSPAQPARRALLTDPKPNPIPSSYPHSVPQPEFIPFPKSVAIRRVCFKLEIESSSSPRPLRVDGFPPINRSSSRANWSTKPSRCRKPSPRSAANAKPF
jgi:hypothetical protein